MTESRVSVSSQEDAGGGNHSSDVNSLLLSGSNRGFHKILIVFQNKQKKTVKKIEQKTME